MRRVTGWSFNLAVADTVHSDAVAGALLAHWISTARSFLLAGTTSSLGKVTPSGTSVMASWIGPVNPPARVNVTVNFVEPPIGRLNNAGTFRAKSSRSGSTLKR